jgi:3-dehydroquinate dehydratase-2
MTGGPDEAADPLAELRRVGANRSELDDMMRLPQRAVLLLNGVNLDLLGQREPEIYGTATLADHVEIAREAATKAGLELAHVQSNHEGVLVEAVHMSRGCCGAIVINPGAFTHYAWALHDALAAFEGYVIEVHLSNPNAREAWRHTSVVSPVATATIAGLGGHGYVLAIQALAHLLLPVL